MIPNKEEEVTKDFGVEVILEEDKAQIGLRKLSLLTRMEEINIRDPFRGENIE